VASDVDEASQNGQRAGRATVDDGMDGNDLTDRATRGVVGAEYSSTCAAVPHRQHPLGLGHRLVGALERFFHVDRHRPGHQEQIGVAGTGDEPDARPFQIVVRITERMDFELAAVAGAGIDMAYAQGTPEHGVQLTLDRRGFRLGSIRRGQRLAQAADTKDA